MRGLWWKRKCEGCGGRRGGERVVEEEEEVRGLWRKRKR